jgi:hypothetical protein
VVVEGSPARFQCTADGWAAGAPQECPEDGCADRAELVAICRARFADLARDLEGARTRLAPAIGYVEEDVPRASER